MAERKFQNNSGLAVTRSGKEPEKQISEPAAKHVVTTDVVKRKKSLGEKVKDTFIQGDINDVGAHIMQDILIPTAIETIRDMGYNLIDGMIYGKDAPSKGYKSRNRRNIARPSYNDTPNRPNGANGASRRSQGHVRGLYIDDIGFVDYVEADMVLQDLASEIEEYGFVYAKVLYNELNWQKDYTIEDYGWTDLRKAKIEFGRDEEGNKKYFLCLPKLEYLG